MRRVIALALFGSGLVGCRDDESLEVVRPPSDQAAPTAASPDRLPPGKLLEGPDSAFELPIPKLLRVDASFPKDVYARGPVPLHDLADYVKERVQVRHVEMVGQRLIFPSARIKGGGDRILRVEVYPKGGEAWLLVHDATPPPAEQGLSEEERWKRVGLTPNGQLIDPQNLE